MTRVIAGTAGGRRLAVPPGRGTRPTSDKAREAMFSTLEALRGTLVGARLLDLFAGSGAVGLEALSRGAAHVLLVEADAAAARVVRANVKTVALPGAEVRAERAERVVAGAGPGEPYDLVFLDPPYSVTDAELREMLITLRAGAGSRTTHSSPWNAAPGVANSAGPGIRSAALPSLRRGHALVRASRLTTAAPAGDHYREGSTPQCVAPSVRVRSTRSPTGISTSSSGPPSSTTWCTSRC